MIEARGRAGLTQAEVADRMGTSQSTITRLA
jgi:transcriptional regulator with XRE-family HTH domain